MKRAWVRVVIVLLAAAGCGVRSSGPPSPERAVVDRWLLCEECTDGELDAVVAAGDRAVDVLGAALVQGPSRAKRENMRLQIRQHYRRLARHSGGRPGVTEAEYLRHFLSNYVAAYQSRGAVALGRIGSDPARAYLRQVLANPGGYRRDVIDAVGLALVSSLATVAGDGQTVPVGSAVPVAPAVRALDRTGAPVEGVEISFAVGAGSGTVTGGVQLTDASGVARVGAWVLGPTPGPQGLTAAAGRVATVLFTAQATAVAGTVLTPHEGAEQVAPVERRVPTPPSVLVTDGSGSPVSGADVTFAVTAGGGSVVPSTAPSDVDGIAQVTRWQLGPLPGPNALTATDASGSATVTFTATGTTTEWQVADAGFRHSCGLLRIRRLACWGSNGAGELGRPPVSGDTTLPVRVVARGFAFSSVAAGAFESSHTCAVTTAGIAFCWGLNRNGQLGDGTATDRDVPTAVLGDLIVRSVTPGGLHTCADSLSGRVYCWGGNDYGQLGDGTTSDRGVPRAASGFVAGQISAGGFHTCAIDLAGRAACWGRNGDGQLGDGTTRQRTDPVAVLGGLRFRTVSAGRAHTCGVTPNDRVFCWGSNRFGQLGDGTQGGRQPAPVAVGGSYAAVDAGANHTCATMRTGAVRCWGANGSGQLGTDDFDDRTEPTPVAGDPTPYVSVRAGRNHTCAVTTTFVARCWGAGGAGELGNGARRNVALPDRVKEPG